MPPLDSQAPYLQVLLQDSDIATSARSVEVEDNDRLIDKATIVVDDPNRLYADFTTKGQSVRVEMGWMTEHAVLFEGDVLEVSGTAGHDGKRLATIKALDRSYRMHLEPRTRDHTGTLSQILRSILTSTEADPPYDINVGQIAPDPDEDFSPPKEPLRQQHETDWYFIQGLAERYGARAFVEFNEGLSRFYFVPEKKLLEADRMGDLTYCNGFRQLVEFRYERIAATTAPPKTATTHDPVSGELVTTPPPPLEPPAPPLTPDAEHAAELAKVNPSLARQYTTVAEMVAGKPSGAASQPSSLAVPGGPSDPQRVKELARRDPTRILGLLGHGLAIGTVKLRAKGKVGIHGISVWAEGDWYVRQATHIFKRGGPGKDTKDTGTYHVKFVVTR